MTSDLDLRTIRLLIAVIEEGSFGKAALRLHISQPSLSVRIRRLEEELGTVLLRRDHRGVEPTPAGELVAEEGGGLLSSAEALGRRIRSLSDERPALRLGFLANAAAEMTPMLVRAFQDRAPDVELELHEFQFGDPLLGLPSGKSDAALLRLPVDQSDEYEMVELFAEPRVAVMSVDHRLAGRASVEVGDLLEEPWVIGSYGAFRDFWILQDHRTSPPPLVLEGETVAEWWSVVTSGRAICASPASAARYDKRPELAFVPIIDAEPSICALAWRRGSAQSGLAALVDAAKQVRRHPPKELCLT